jgi:hypothetical protein
MFANTDDYIFCFICVVMVLLLLNNKIYPLLIIGTCAFYWWDIVAAVVILMTFALTSVAISGCVAGVMSELMVSHWGWSMNDMFETAVGFVWEKWDAVWSWWKLSRDSRKDNQAKVGGEDADATKLDESEEVSKEQVCRVCSILGGVNIHIGFKGSTSLQR